MTKKEKRNQHWQLKSTALNDGLSYTFTIRKDAKWSNGEPITANDFEYSWKRTVDPKTASPQAYYFEGLKIIVLLLTVANLKKS